MSVFGGMSKGERNRIKIRVRSAMAAQAKIEGRFLRGRPPYGYRRDSNLRTSPENSLREPRLGSTRTSWGYGLCPRGDLNPHAR